MCCHETVRDEPGPRSRRAGCRRADPPADRDVVRCYVAPAHDGHRGGDPRRLVAVASGRRAARRRGDDRVVAAGPHAPGARADGGRSVPVDDRPGGRRPVVADCGRGAARRGTTGAHRDRRASILVGDHGRQRHSAAHHLGRRRCFTRAGSLACAGRRVGDRGRLDAARPNVRAADDRVDPRGRARAPGTAHLSGAGGSASRCCSTTS